MQRLILALLALLLLPFGFTPAPAVAQPGLPSIAATTVPGEVESSRPVSDPAPAAQPGLPSIPATTVPAVVASSRPVPGPPTAPPEPTPTVAQPAVPDRLSLIPPPAPPPVAPAQVSSCQQLLADPTVAIANAADSPWRAFRGSRSIVADQAFSSPNALLLPAGGGGTVNTVGQVLTNLPATLNELAGSLRVRLEPGADDGVQLQVELYASSGSELRDLIARRELNLAGLATGSWRAFEWEIGDAGALQQIRGRSGLSYAVSVLNVRGASLPRIWLDDLTLNACTAGGSIAGTVRQGTEPAAGADLLLVRDDGAAQEVLARATSAADGSYRFDGVPALADSSSYRVWFVNAPAAPARTPGRIGFWAGPLFASFAAGQTATGQDLNIADVALTGPAPEAALVATDATPARLSWNPRPAAGPGERHRFCLYDPLLAAPPGQEGPVARPLELCAAPLDPAAAPPSFALGPNSFATTPGFSLRYGRNYRWYVVVCADTQCQQYGYSLFERAVSFLPASPVPSPQPPAPPAGDLPAGVANASWTLLIYVAADNALGDPSRTPRTALPVAQLARLAPAAATSPRINVLSYVDGFGPGGATLCVYQGGGATCRGRPEPNTGTAAPLAALISESRTRFPAARTALLIVAPANAVGQLATDESDGGDVLSLDELDDAYRSGLGDARLDLVIYQAPTMGTLDVLRATAPHARFMVAAPDQIWQLAAADRVTQTLANAAGADAAARETLGAYLGALDAVAPGRAFAMAAYDLTRATAVISTADDLALTMRLSLDSQRATLLPLLETARTQAQRYDSSGNGRHDQLESAVGPLPAAEDGLVDLRGLARRLRDDPASPGDVDRLAGELFTLFTDPARTPVIAAVLRPGLSLAGAPLSFSDASALALFFPSGERLGGQPALTEVALYGRVDRAPGVSDWAPLLRSYLRDRIGQGPGGVTAAPTGGGGLRPLLGGTIQTAIWLPLTRR